MIEKLGIKSRWDIAPAVLAVLMYVNFIVFIILLFMDTGALFLYPEPSLLTAGMLIAGIIAHLITRRKACKLWRRLLLGAIAANFLVIIILIVLVVVAVTAWMVVLDQIKSNG